MESNSLFHINLAAQAICNKKGLNILALNIQEQPTFIDYMLIAEGSVDRHVIAIAKNLIETLKKEKLSPVYVEGLESGDWIVLDYTDFIIHLFMPGLRDKYQLERLWPESELVDLDLDSMESASNNDEIA